MNIKTLAGGAIVASLAGLFISAAASSSGSTPSRTDSGTVVCTTDANGYCPAVTLPWVPSAVVVTANSPIGGAAALPFQNMASVSGNTFQPRFLTTTGAIYGSKSVTYSYIATTTSTPVVTPSPPNSSTPVPPPTTSVPPTPSPTPTTSGACGGPITITAGGTYSGCYQSNSTGTPAVTVATASPVTLDHATVVAKGYGLRDSVAGVKLTVTNSKFTQQDPGAVVDHRAIALAQGAGAVDIEHNSFVNTDGIWVTASSSAGLTINGVKVNYNYFENIGHWPNPKDFGCCVQAIQFSETTIPGAEIGWNHTKNILNNSAVEDNINFWRSGGTTASPTNEHDNLVDGAYPNGPNTQYTGGGINVGDESDHDNVARNNTVVSTTNFGVGIGSTRNYAYDNLLVNDGNEQKSDFGQAVSAYGTGLSPNATPPGFHTSGNRYNWHRFAGDTQQWQCYPDSFCANGTQVNLTEQQARDQWATSVVAAGVTVGPNW